ncbi:AMP-binding protein [Palleronia sp. KMU-117]|uniref:AMP-binding protein n=1 Tax=Palleronia sp. KMU-117 TaxID=3434108 RepID=UPI003D7189F3
MTPDQTTISLPGDDGWRRFSQRFDQIFDRTDGTLFADLETGPLTYAACRAEMLRLADRLRRAGIEPGDRIIVHCDQARRAIVLFLAMLRSGITPVMADAAATDAELSELVGLCRARALVTDGVSGEAELRLFAPDGSIDRLRLEEDRDGAPPDRFADPQDVPQVAVLVLTSGTTSAPKAIELTFANLVAQLDIFHEVYGFDETSRLFNLLPLHHVDGLIRGPLTAIWFGGSLHRPMRFSVQAVPAILDYVRNGRVTHFISVPAMLRIVHRVGRDRASVFDAPEFRFVLSSADLLDEGLWEAFEDTFGVPVVNAYGLSEVVCDAIFAGPDGATRRRGSLGRPVGCKAMVLDAHDQPVAPGAPGELVLSGPIVMRGYFDAPEETAKVLRNGRFYTGDIVRVDPDGLFRFVGRKKTAIVSAGKTIHPETATQVLTAMPGVAEAYAFGVPDPTMGERLVAAIVPAPDAVIRPEDVAAYCRSQLSSERSPREFFIVDALPRTPSGKVMAGHLQAMYARPTPDAPDVLEVAARCFNLPVTELSLQSTPFNTEGWDSLAHIELIDSLEEAFDIQFSALQITQIMSLGDALRAIEENLA